MTKADRNPTSIQFFTLLTSLLTMVISGLNGYFKTGKAKSQMEAKSNDGLDKLLHKASHLPLFLSGYLFYLGSLVMISTLFPLYTLILISLIALACTIYAILRSIYDKLGKERKGRKLSVSLLKGKRLKQD